MAGQIKNYKRSFESRCGLKQASKIWSVVRYSFAFDVENERERGVGVGRLDGEGGEHIFFVWLSLRESIPAEQLGWATFETWKPTLFYRASIAYDK